MQRELNNCGLRLTPYGTQQLEQLVSLGLERMRRSKAIDHPGLVINAEQNLRKLARYLADYAREAGTLPVLQSHDFDAAMRTCPAFWPYCSTF